MTAQPLGHDVYRIELPLPFPTLRAVNVYAFSTGEGITLLDCGVDGDRGMAGLRAALHDIGPGPEGVRRLIGSHLHVDHVGLARRVIEETGCEFVMHQAAADGLDVYNDWSRIFRWARKVAATNGAPADVVEELGEETPRPDWAGPVDEPDVLLKDGDAIDLGDGRTLQVVHTPGHDDAHMCLVDSRTGLLFSGDHVLPRITPYVPYRRDDQDSLGQYLSSLERIELLDPGLTYPGHLDPVPDGRGRARQITFHHERRLGAMLQDLRHGPRTAWQVMEAVFRPNLLRFEQRLALNETLAHLEHLRWREQVERFEDDDGVRYYRRPTR